MNSQSDFTHQLQDLMQQVGFSSFKDLARSSGVSLTQLVRLRRGEVEQMRLDVLLKLSKTLQMSLPKLVATFSSQNIVVGGESQPASTDLKREYDRLQAQLEQQRQIVWQEFQQSSLDILESLITYLPTVAHKAQDNPDVTAVTVLRILQPPIAQLLQQWGVEAIAPVGAELPYNPQLHQLTQGIAQPGETVIVRYTGYRQGEKLLYRAKVSPTQE